jgi:hypothetical protein
MAPLYDSPAALCVRKKGVARARLAAAAFCFRLLDSDRGCGVLPEAGCPVYKRVFGLSSHEPGRRQSRQIFAIF